MTLQTRQDLTVVSLLGQLTAVNYSQNRYWRLAETGFWHYHAVSLPKLSVGKCWKKLRKTHVAKQLDKWTRI